jgi:hypothetical protein
MGIRVVLHALLRRLPALDKDDSDFAIATIVLEVVASLARCWASSDGVARLCRQATWDACWRDAGHIARMACTRDCARPAVPRAVPV